MSGDRFTPQGLAEILRDRFVEESSCCLVLSADTGEEIRIHFCRGLIDLALQTGPHLTFLSDLASSALKGAGVPRELASSPPTPDALAEFLGPQVSSPAVQDAVQRETFISIQEAFRLSGGSWTLEPCETTGVFDPDVVSTLEAILRGIGAIERWAQVGRVMASQDRRLKPCTVPLFPVNQLPLAPEEGYLLSLMDGQATYSQVLSLFPGSEPDQVTRFVYSALVIGAVEFDPPLDTLFRLGDYARVDEAQRERATKERERIHSFYGMLRTSTPYQTLGVTDGATWNEIKQAYEERKASFQGAQFLPEVRQECREELQIIESGLVEVFLKIQSLRMDAAGERSRERAGDRGEVTLEEMQGKRLESTKTCRQEELDQQEQQAALYLAKARDAFREGDFHNTVEYCNLALKNHAGAPELHSLLGQALARNPARRWQLRAEESFKRAVDLDPWNPQYHMRMGEFYKNQGLEQRAARCFQKARELAPGQRESRGNRSQA